MEGLGFGVYEIVDDHRGDTYRAVYVVNVGDCIHVLHAFQKKSKSGISTPRQDVELGREAIESAACSARQCIGGETWGRRFASAAQTNVLVDFGFEDAKELTAKATLALKLNRILEERKLTQVEAAELLGMPQSKVSQIKNYKLQNISLERLMQALVALDQRVEILVKASRRQEDAAIAVAI